MINWMSLRDTQYDMNVPGLQIVVPATPADAMGLLRTAIRGEDPVLCFEHKMLYAIKGEVSDDPDFTVPFEQEAVCHEGTDIASVRKTSRVVIVYEAHERPGPGAEIAAMITEEAIGYLDGPTVRVVAKNVPLPYSPELENYVLPQVSDIVAKTRDLARSSL